MRKESDSRVQLAQLVRNLQDSYMIYMKSLKAVLDEGEANIPELIQALNHKHANPVAKALGLMMYSPRAAESFPLLLDWLIVQSPMYPDVLEALTRAGSAVVPLLIQRLYFAASKGDDEAVRNLLDLGSRLKGDPIYQIVQCANQLLRHENDQIREAAADALWRIGLPGGKSARSILAELVNSDPCKSVRDACEEALVRLNA